ncbi:hypothetical protein F5Y00DRAFT_96270 [Daldinia vernicosa]|uniref:uncharacterized protein n=1 Tax=Daldinia vernicosa TaxID=114800 RepID=UPI002008BCF1|nr:uncharacterized protein F5Y00DRAFT_96270 [Daldinia vernicosa]KAI0847977.1 hypothetical protein F5Y00DRAFT_96270 [Daldinia vernicosa]
MVTGPWLQAVIDEPPENLVRDLTPDSPTMKALREDFTKANKDIKIVSCHERRETPTAVKQENGTLKRCGPPAMMVREGSACLGWDNEKTIPINENHSMIAKLTRKEGSAYHRVKDAIADTIREAQIIVPRLFQNFNIREQLRNIASTSTTLCYAVQSATSSESDVRGSIEQGLVRMSGLCDTLLHDQFGDFFLGTQAPSKYVDLIARDIEELAHTIQTYLSFDMTNDEAQPLDTVVQFGSKVFRLTETLQQTMSSRMLQTSSAASFSGLSFRESGLAHIARQQQLFRSAKQLQPATPLPGALRLFSKHSDPCFREDLTLGQYTPDGRAGSLQSQTVIVEHRRYNPPKQGTHEISSEEKQRAMDVKVQTQKLAAILSQIDKDPNTIDSLHSLRCLGFVDNDKLGELSFLYEIPSAYCSPNGMVSPQFMTLKQAIQKLARSPLEVRFSLAYRVCVGLLNIHNSGWVHKNICSSNILCAVAKERDETLRVTHWDLYIKGFEASREALAKSSLSGEWDENTLYRHPDRQETPLEKFNKGYDIYSLGLVLLEIGTGELIEKLYANVRGRLPPGEDFTPFGWQSVLLKWAKRKLPSAMGTRYATAVAKCIEGEFQISSDNDQQTELALMFQRTLLQSIGAGVMF